MSASSYRLAIVYNPKEKRHIVRDPWYFAHEDEVLTEEYSETEDEKLKVAVKILDALHGNATAYMAFIQTFLEPKAES